ncbi:hypothetical protein CLOSTMETH_01205 [[Clostridium] methylpentosum DSM 5476]|jgi:uncharacterized membrane protein|uniref:Chloroplast import component protein (Tic20) n=1 Tax=[Clostridium] methylpentosum DSM 5476 TaxID=537013 RepID=C0EBI7_9FIRM|nr:hypothetical protein CLOSTMETH_01205 [[Clostridium] methylpentosum DSM 5476]MDY3988180.1 hypothetical protein [Massilioclostridium sp.]MEE1491219.1 hypothetical protein [Massilioclostridium sp.]
MLSTKDKVLAALAYCGILFFLPLVASDNLQYGKYHANQGLIFLLFCVVTNVATWIVRFIPFIGWIVSTVIGIITFILFVIGLINGASGKMQPLPVIGSMFTLLQ